MRLERWRASLRAVAARIIEVVRRRRLARELDEELRLHVELETAYNIERGMAPVEAERRARASFGGVRQAAERTMDARGFVLVEHIARDSRFAFRRLAHTPLFTAGVVAAMVIGVVAAVAIGALVFQVLMRPLPYARPETIARVLVHTPGLGTASTESSGGIFVHLSERAHAFSALGGYYESEGVSATDGQPEHLRSALITPNLFGILGVRPAAGRLFTAADLQAKPSPVMISYDVWMRRFGGDPAISGRVIELNLSRRTIVGVLPRGFDFPSASTAIWYTEGVSATVAGLNFRYLNLLARLAPGVTPGAAAVEVNDLAARLPERFPDLSAAELRTSGLSLSVEPLKDATVAPVRAELTLVSIMAVIILLVALANVTTLFLLRAERMQGEIALSRALGAGRSALYRRFIVEGIVIAAASGVMAAPLISWLLTSRFGLTADELPRAHEVGVSFGVYGALAGLLALAGIGLGLAGAARTSRASIEAQLRRSSPGARARGWKRAQSALVAAQVASAMALLFGAGLVGQSLYRLAHVNIGFVPRPSTTFDISLPFLPYPRLEDASAFDLSVIRDLGRLPGVTSVTTAMVLPFEREAPAGRRRIITDGEPVVREATARPNIVPPNYFQTMGIPVRSGRSFASGDLRAPSPAIVISASLAQQLFGRVDATGRRIRVPDSLNFPVYQIVGVVGDVYGERIEDGIMPTLYFPLVGDAPLPLAHPSDPHVPRFPYRPSGMRFVVFSELPATALLSGIRRAVAAADPKVPVMRMSSLDEIAAQATARARLVMLLLAVASTAALILSAIGVYSVIGFAVGARGREFGIRLALGATPAAIVRSVLGGSLSLVASGLACGAAIAAASGSLLRHVLFDVSPASPAMYLTATAAMLIVSVAAAYVPARTAGRTDPTRALRAE